MTPTNEETIVSLTAWSYDPKFCALLSAIKIGPERLAGGETIYRVPKCTTLIEPPPTVPSGKRAVFIERTGSWIVVSDHRGETWYDYANRPHVIERLGNPELWGMRPTSQP